MSQGHWGGHGPSGVAIQTPDGSPDRSDFARVNGGRLQIDFALNSCPPSSHLPKESTS
jgi:hypothetical protein